MNIIKKNYNKFIFLLAVNIIICLFFNLLFYCKYHTVDDVFMAMIVSGGYGEPDAHLIFMSTVLGWILKALYNLTSIIPWYALMQISFSIISFTTIAYVFCNRKNKILKVLVWIAIFIVSYEAYTKIQFTKTASYLATAGFVVIAYSFESDNRKQNQILGVVLLTLSSMVRFGMFLGCSAIALGCLLPKIIKWLKNIKENKKDILDLITVGCISLVFVFGCLFIDKLNYKNDGWDKYIEFNHYVTQLQDINWPSYDEYSKEIENLGISKSNYDLYSTLDFNDPDKFSIEIMGKFSNLQPYGAIDANQIYLFVIRGIRNIFEQTTTGTFTYFIILLVIFFFVSKSYECELTLSLIYSFLMSCFSFAYTYYMHGWFDRTSISILFSALITVLYLLKPKRLNKIKYGLVFTIAYALICLCLLWRNDLKINKTEERNKFLNNQSLINEITNDNKHLYLCRAHFGLRKNYYMAYDQIENGVCINFQPLGDWVSNTPLSTAALNKYGVRNPYKDIINNDEVYLIGDEDDLDQIIKYINNNYDESVSLKFVKNIGDYYVFYVK